MKRLWVVLAIVVIGAAAGGLVAVLAHTSDKERVLDACHVALLKEGKGQFRDEQVADPQGGSFVATGFLGASQWSCTATITRGAVRVIAAELRQ